ncbi:serine hydrolase domain-containing protein [Duganella qianjiadongensis]|uniref:Serine hydrolase n=1 Tax=Duganella qianjiadongensis TaxID=2692176 RepID=A0ABW9VEJ3_9BURK|nr:serine hydrolase domain-containing protein [Duganella qianjiadongensis]MYM38031.1 serine hydrolase [Duganella qianjiadongensis]
MHKPALVSALLLALTSGVALAQTAVPAALEERIARVEQGLLLPVVVQGQSATGMSLRDRMAYWRVPGVSIALINHGAVEWARGYGVTDAGGTQAVTPQTLFQAGSVSKPVTAALVLRLAAAARLDLDEDVNRRLRGWQVAPGGPAVSARALLSHTAGMPEYGLTGYAAGTVMPTLAQVLHGQAPASNPPAVRVAGQEYAYSSLGYVVLQQYLEDALQRPFAVLAQDEVLRPLGMKATLFAPSLEGPQAAQAAAGHDLDGAVLAGRWRRHPELAPTGLWSTAPDLARFALALQRSAAGQYPQWLSAPASKAMLTPVSNEYGLGLELDHAGSTAAFHHSGSTIGYKALLFAYTQTGQGVVILTNGDGAWPLIEELMRSIAAEYGWEDYRPISRVAMLPQPALFDQFTGQYKVGNTTLQVTRAGDQLMLAGPPLGPAALELIASGPYDFFVREKDATLHFDPNQGRPVQTVTFVDGRPRPGQRQQ